MRLTQRLWMLVLAGWVGGLNAAAQEVDDRAAGAQATAVRVRQIYVPADEPSAWPTGDWIPLARQELQGLLDRSESSAPAEAYLEKAVYRARYSGTSLVGGTLEAVARLRSENPQFVDLGSPAVAISRLHWSGREAVWGLADDGRSLLRVDEDGAVLTGRWSLSGRRVFSTVEFDVRVPPATVSQLELELPASRQLTTDNGLISRIADSDRAGWKVWSIDLGRRTSCRLQVGAAGTAARKSPRELQVSQVSTYSFVDSDLRIQTDIAIQSVSGEFDTLEVVVPPAMIFSSITAGNDTILPAWRKQDQQRSLLVVDVSGITLGAGTRLRLRGQLPLRLGARQGLPRLGLVGGRWLQFRRQVRVVSPLQLRDLEQSETRLVNSSMGLDSGAALEFDDLTPGSLIRVTVDTPQPELSARVLSRVDWQQSDPQLRTELSYEAQTGSTYSLECDVPADWEVTRVDAGSAVPVAQWRTAWDADSGRNRLSVELRSALSPQSPVRISVLARPRAALLGESVETPVVMPLVSGEREVTVVIAPPPGSQLELPADSDYQTIALADLVAERPELGEEFTEIGDSRLLVLQAADPGAGQFLTVRSPQIGGPNGADAGAAAADRNEAGGDHAGSDEVDSADDPATGASIRVGMQVFTLVAAERGRLCRNRVVLSIPPLAAPQTLRLRLPDTVRLLSAATAFPHRTTGREVVVEFPATAEGTEVLLSYESPLEHSLLSGLARIPLPEWDGTPTTIGWQIEMPQPFRLRDPTDGSTAVATPHLSWTQRILGPLGRPADRGVFWPFSAAAWQAWGAGASEDSATAAGEVQRMHRSLAGERDSLTLAFWNVAAARQVGWVVLLISLLITSWPFQAERLLRPGWTFKMVLIGSAAALLSPELLAIPWGGFVVGASLGALLPERWRRPRRREVVSEKSTPGTRTALRLSASVGILLASCLIEAPPCHGWQAASQSDASRQPDRQGAAQAEPSDRAEQASAEAAAPLDVLIPVNDATARTQELPSYVYVDRAEAYRVLGPHLTSSPRYLLRSAAYTVEEFNVSRPELTARYDVVLLHPETETRVVLALSGVQFPDARLCRVDGTPATLLPHRSGEGVVVVVPAGSAAEDGQETSVQVELVCQPRPAADEQGPRLDLGIPRILASHLTIHSADPSAAPIQTVHAGSSTHRAAEGLWRVVLGGQGHLIADPKQEQPLQRWQEAVSAASVIEVHPMRLRIDSRLTFRTLPQWSRLDGQALRLQLPAGSVVRDVRADGLQQKHTSRNGRGPVLLDLKFTDAVAADLNVEISFDLPADRLAEGSGIVVPPLAFLKGMEQAEFPLHRIGVAAAPGFRLTAADPEGMMPGTTGIDESQLPAWRGSRTARTAEATYQLTSSRPLEIPLAPIAPSVSTSVRQTLTVRSSTVEWAATLQMSIRDAPLALHRLQIDPRVNVRQVSVTQETVDRLASWSRTAPEHLVLFLKEELSGAQTVQLRGTLAVEDRHDFVIPSLSVDGVSLTEPPEVVVQHAAGTPIVVAADDGTVVAGEPSATPTDGIVQLATLNLDPTLPPLRIQRARSEPAFDIEQMTVIETLEQQQARWTRLIRIDASRVSQETLTLEVASAPPQVQLAASVPTTEEVVDGETRLNLDVTAAENDVIDVTIAGRSPLPAGMLPEVRVAGVPVPQHLVVILEGVPVGIDGGERVDPESLSEWFRENLSVVERPAGLVLEAGGGSIQLAPPVEAGAEVWLQRFDSAVWLQPDGGRRGVSVADVTALRPTLLEFSLPEGMLLHSAELDGRLLSTSPYAPVAFEIPAAQMPQRLVIWWSDDSALDDGLPLPVPQDLSGAPVHAVLFGSDQEFYLFDEAVRMIGLAELVQEASLRETADGPISPIWQALVDAGFDPEAATPSAADAGSMTHAVRMEEQRELLPVHVVDRQLAAVLGLLLAAGGGLIIWFVTGLWSERVSAAARSATGFPGLILLAAAVWLLGISWLGFVALMLLIGLWVADLRRPLPPEESESRLQPAH